MSDLTSCNFCKMQGIERDAKRNGKKVVKIPSAKMQHLGGWEIHVIKKGEVLSGKNWICWMMEITDHCMC